MLNLLPLFGQINTLKNRKTVVEFFLFKSLPQSLFKVRKSCMRKEKKNKKGPLI